MKQMTFSDVEYSGRKKVTQKEKFLREMDAIIPWGNGLRRSRRIILRGNGDVRHAGSRSC